MGTFLSHYLWVVKSTPQNLVKAKKLGGR
ncbi:S-layer homology domain-containing protein, partial [Bacillus cereus]|nr:S-layer homology domain-containing protein [Bacillus cereus]